MKLEPLARGIKGNKMGFYKYIGDKRMTGVNMGPLLNEAGDTGHGKG